MSTQVWFETDNGSSGYSAKGACGAETSAEINSGRDTGRIKYKKSSLSGKEGFCQRMTGSFFRLCMYTGKPVEWNGLVVFVQTV